MPLSLLTVITTSALLSSSITAVSQDESEQLPSEITDPNFVKKYGHLLSLHQPVLIEPPEATCTQGNITLDRSYLSSYYNGTDVTYQCAANCSRIHPDPHDIIYLNNACKLIWNFDISSKILSLECMLHTEVLSKIILITFIYIIHYIYTYIYIYLIQTVCFSMRILHQPGVD